MLQVGVEEGKEACEPRQVLLWRRVSAGPLARVSGDFPQSLILVDGSVYEARQIRKGKGQRASVREL